MNAATIEQARGWAVCVVVPAHNEEALIADCLQTVAASLAAAPSVARSWVVVVADACTDRTADLARAQLGSGGEVVTVTATSVGAARRLGAAAGLGHLADYPLDRCWLLNTDADTCVPSDWVQTQLSFAAAGMTAVAGIVRVDDFCDNGPHAAAAFAATYELRPDGSHPHVHGANLGVRADVYLRAGGWRRLNTAEDHCLWDRLQRGGWRTAASTASVVTTSGRTVGRAPAGFAARLRQTCETFEACDE